MSIEYDKYYQAEEYFGAPFPELINFYSNLPNKGKLLDLGCGQGRDAIALARLGFEVTGIDHSKVGIQQLNQIAAKEQLSLQGIAGDIFEYPHLSKFDFILLDSMFHFGKKEKEKEIEFLEKIFEKSKPGALITICIQKMAKKLRILNSIIPENENIEVVDRLELTYQFEDKRSNHRSRTLYEMITLKKN